MPSKGNNEICVYIPPKKRTKHAERRASPTDYGRHSPEYYRGVRVLLKQIVAFAEHPIAPELDRKLSPLRAGNDYKPEWKLFNSDGTYSRSVFER